MEKIHRLRRSQDAHKADASASGGIREMKTKLYNDRIATYGSTANRPVRNDSLPVKVGFRMLIDHLVHFDEPKQQVTLFSSIKMVWTDEYLAWNESDYGGLSSVEVDVDNIWRPGISLLTSNSPDFLTLSHRRIRVCSNGNITWLSPAIITSSCIFDVYYFPFDVQRCILEFGPWADTRDRVDVYFFFQHDETTMNRYRDNGVWSITNDTVRRNLRNYSCCDEPFTEIYYEIDFRREFKVYVLYLIVPSLLLSLSTLLIFMLPPESGEKISFGITNLVAIMLFQETVRAAMPPTGSPAFAIYICIMVVVACVSLFSAAVVLRLYSMGDATKAPVWLHHSLVKKRKKTLMSNDGSVNDVIEDSPNVTSENQKFAKRLLQIELNTSDASQLNNFQDNHEGIHFQGIHDQRGRSNSFADESDDNAQMWKDIALSLERKLALFLLLCIVGNILFWIIKMYIEIPQQ